MKLNIFLFLASSIALASCVDIPDFSDTPKIYYNGISQRTVSDTTESGVPQDREIVTITIDFEDGDGDLGIDRDQLQDPAITKPYKNVPNWGLEGNYELVTMTLQPNGNWTEAIGELDSSKFFYNLKPDGKPGPIKGKLDLYATYRYSRSAVQATQKFKVRIIDRAFHISNRIDSTDRVVVPIFQ